MAAKRKRVYDTGRPEIDRKIEELLNEWSVAVDFNWFREMMVTVLKFAEDQPRSADVRLFNIALKEMRYADKVFQEYEGIKSVSVFGSARVKPSSVLYKTAKRFGQMMKNVGYMVITGGGGGIMAAAQEGAGRERSFALNISLPFEQSSNSTIMGDRKLITFKYFFTRKLNFVKHAHAIALFPGGFGTMDECFEALTLIQTGKAPIVPIVMVDQPGGKYWTGWERYVRQHLLGNKTVSAQDFNLIKITQDLKEARSEILKFYANFHSYRFVNDLCVMRVHREIPQAALQRMSKSFAHILTGKKGFKMGRSLPQEVNEPEIAHLPRLLFHFNKHDYGHLRKVIDCINQF